MTNIINTKRANEHTIEPYHFKVLGGGISVIKSEDEAVSSEASNIKPEDKPSQKEISEPVVQIDEQQNRFIEELLKKSDELSSNIIKLQMQIEKQEKDFNNRLESELERESQNAYEKGYQKAKNDLEEDMKALRNRFLDSINTMDSEVKKGNEILNKFENELSSAALEVAKEVILKELKESSSSIASTLSKKLIEELKDAKSIKLKVNPKDYEALAEAYADMANISVESDGAITEGGVVVLSDAGNLDGNIMTRLEKVKSLIRNG